MGCNFLVDYFMTLAKKHHQIVTTGVLTKIWTRHIPNRCLEHYHYTNMFNNIPQLGSYLITDQSNLLSPPSKQILLKWQYLCSKLCWGTSQKTVISILHFLSDYWFHSWSGNDNRKTLKFVPSCTLCLVGADGGPPCSPRRSETVLMPAEFTANECRGKGGPEYSGRARCCWCQ
jgi:hypothetical protein